MVGVPPAGDRGSNRASPALLRAARRLLFSKKQKGRPCGGSVAATGNTGADGARVLVAPLGVAARGGRRRGGTPGLAVAANIAAGNAATRSGKDIASAGPIRDAAANWSPPGARAACAGVTAHRRHHQTKQRANRLHCGRRLLLCVSMISPNNGDNL